VLVVFVVGSLLVYSVVHVVMRLACRVLVNHHVHVGLWDKQSCIN
jgi:hypothetical protein